MSATEVSPVPTTNDRRGCLVAINWQMFSRTSRPTARIPPITMKVAAQSIRMTERGIADPVREKRLRTRRAAEPRVAACEA